MPLIKLLPDIDPILLHIRRMLRLKKNRPARIETARGERVYAIGDVHGRHDLLKKLIEKIISHWETAEKNCTKINLIFLGDIIDRGPDSARCLALVEKFCRLSEAKFILGNHEDLLLRTLDGDEDARKIWFQHGGIETLKSFGVKKPSAKEDSFDFAERLAAAIPEKFIALLKNAPTHITNGNYYFVHAGVRPGVSLSDQTDFDKFFIRDEFTESDAWHGAMIVHGHTIVDSAELRPNRIAIDTGAYKTGQLSCLCLQGSLRQIITT